jgi:hypothetical protein
VIKINGREISKKEWHNYGYFIYEKYKEHASNKSLVAAFTVADHLWLDYLLNLLLQVESFPNARLPPAIDQSYYINFSKTKDLNQAKENAKAFLDGFNKFYVDINFDQYISDTKPYYTAALEQVNTTLSDARFIKAMEKFYNRSFQSYTLIPSLTIPKGMGFGLRHSTNGQTHVFNVFGAFDPQKFDQMNRLDMGFANSERLNELSVHEFGHSFVNPVVDKLEPEQISATARLFEPIKSSMSDQGYNSWKTCLYEHFVRAGEIIIAKKLDNNGRIAELRSWYVERRKFKYLPILIQELEKYDEGKTKSYDEAVDKAMNELSKIK